MTISLLDRIRSRPELYLGEKSLVAFRHFVNGYKTALGAHGIDEADTQLPLPDDLHDWVAYRTHHHESTSGWVNMIRVRFADDAAAFDRFFELLDEHAVRQPHLVATLTGLEREFTRTTYPPEETDFKHPDPRYTVTLRYPSDLSLVTFNDDDPGFFVYSDESADFPGHGFCPNLSAFEIDVASRSELRVVDAATFEKWNAADGS